MNTDIPHSLNLRANDWVVVRSKAEILSTLDERARLDQLPFQPEMFAFCGRKMRVQKVAHKTCDTIHKTGGRRMHNAVHLEGARCDGGMHGGCQADCVFFWKEAWLKRAEDPAIAAPLETEPCNESTVQSAASSKTGGADEDPVWVCQTTSLYEATELLKWWNIRQYVRDVTSGNHSAWHVIKLLIDAAYRRLVSLGIGYGVLIRVYDSFQRLRGGDRFPAIAGSIPSGQPTPAQALNLLPGEWVEVKSAEEIGSTLTDQGFNRGMRFDMEMLKYSGKRYRVQMRVDRLINEQTGKMMEMKTPCIQLEDVYCRAECTPMRLGCPRASNTYWREIWLRRVDGPGSTQRKGEASRIPVREI
jgi:hypothetical protein